MDINLNLINIFNNSYSYEEYKNALDEPLDADLKATQNVEDDYPHYQECYLILNDKITQAKNEKTVELKPLIRCLYFVYTDLGEKEYDNKYWFFIGKLEKNLSEFYFSYESGCSGTGFGLGETSVIHFSKTKELLLTYGLTDKQRNLIKSELETR